jgi:hypothetical protein
VRQLAIASASIQRLQALILPTSNGTQVYPARASVRHLSSSSIPLPPVIGPPPGTGSSVSSSFSESDNGQRHDVRSPPHPFRFSPGYQSRSSSRSSASPPPPQVVHRSQSRPGSARVSISSLVEGGGSSGSGSSGGRTTPQSGGIWHSSAETAWLRTEPAATPLTNNSTPIKWRTGIGSHMHDMRRGRSPAVEVVPYLRGPGISGGSSQNHR